MSCKCHLLIIFIKFNKNFAFHENSQLRLYLAWEKCNVRFLHGEGCMAPTTRKEIDTNIKHKHMLFVLRRIKIFKIQDFTTIWKKF